MAFEKLFAAAVENSNESIQLAGACATFLLTTVSVSAGFGWFIANTLAKRQLEIFKAAREFAQEKEKELRLQVETLQDKRSKQPTSPELRAETKTLDQALIDLQGARQTVGEAYDGVEYVVGSVFNGLKYLVGLENPASAASNAQNRSTN